MLKTPFAGLTQLDPEEPLSLDDFSFQAENPMRIDRLLEVGAVTHRHDAHAALANPSAAPTAASFVGSGTIPGDTTIEFGYTLIDADGGETEVSPIDAVTTPPQIGAPSGAITATANYTAGQLKPATYYYGRTFVDGGGGETPLGAIRAVDVEPGHANARVLLAGLSGGMVAVGAAGWKLYRARDGGNFTYLASGSGNTLTDDGTLCIDCDQNPPEFNTTQSFNRVQVTLPVRPADAVEWRLYGTVQSGIWDLFSYVASGSGSAAATVVLPSFVPTRGRPPARSTALRGASQIDPDTELFDWHWLRPVADEAALPVVGNASGDVRLTLSDGAFHTWLNGDWQDTGGGGGGGGVPLVGDFHASASGTVAPEATRDFVIAVPSGGTIEDVELSIWCNQGETASNIGLSLISPDGHEALLWDGQGAEFLGSGSASTARAIFTDEADRQPGDSGGLGFLIGRFQPVYVNDEPPFTPYRMSDFRGKTATGTWKVRLINYDLISGGLPLNLFAASLHFKTFGQRDSMQFTVAGAVGSGSANAIPPQFVSINPLGGAVQAGAGRIVKVRHKLASGSAAITVRKNGVNLSSFTSKTVTTAAADAAQAHPGWHDVAQDDMIEVVVANPSADARVLTVTVHVEKRPPI